MERQLDLVSMELHELTSIFGHETMHNVHLLGAQASPTLQLVGKAGEDFRVHATEAHAVVVGDVGLDLLVGSLIAEDGEEATLSPAHVGGEFGLQRFECVLLIHHTYMLTEQ